MTGLYQVFYAAHIFLRIITAAIFIYCVLSWFQPRFQLFYTLRRFIQPFVSPFQRLSLWIARYFRAPIDLTCWFAIIAYQLLDRLWWRLYALIVMGVARR